MKTLEQIQDEVGKDVFSYWENAANYNLALSKYRDQSTEAQHAFIYEQILKRYEMYRKVFTFARVPMNISKIK